MLAVDHFRRAPRISRRRSGRRRPERKWAAAAPPVAGCLLLAALCLQVAAFGAAQRQAPQWARWPPGATKSLALAGETRRPTAPLPALSGRQGAPRNATRWIPMVRAPGAEMRRRQEPAAATASFKRRLWRRPRFHQHQEPLRKLYRRVLLCEKTLVSLDYLRLQPPPAGPLPELLGNHVDVNDDDDDPDNFIDNFIDAGTRRLDTSWPPAANLSDAPQAAQSRSYLTDEDPLVKCDMWDLEKGLKSRKPPEEALRMAVRADFDTVRDAINRCRQLTERTLPPDDEFGRDGLEVMSTDDLISLFSMKRGLIPGTKWCGLGDQASSYNDLGPKHRIDVCCRAHDHCPIRLKPFRNDYGVLNLALYTKSHCDCDADFYRCLREAHSRTADMLGNLYFNVMKLQCMREERQKVCREMRPLALGFERCVRYEDSPVKRVFRFTGPPVAY